MPTSADSEFASLLARAYLYDQEIFRPWRAQICITLPPEADEVELIIGGMRYVVEREVLEQFPHSYFTTLLSQFEMMPAAQGSDGALSIQRPGHLFGHILTFLRNWPFGGELVSPNLTTTERNELAMEADFYLLEPLTWLLCNAPPDWYKLSAEDVLNRQQVPRAENTLESHTCPPVNVRSRVRAGGRSSLALLPAARHARARRPACRSRGDLLFW